MLTPNYLELEELVKYCVLDGAIINGISLDNCIGKISEEVKYNGLKLIVNTQITPEDIEAFYQVKESQYQY